MKAPRSFAVRLVFWFTLLGIVPSVVMAAFAYSEVRDTDQEYALRHLRTAALAQSAAVRACAADQHDALEGLFATPTGLGKTGRTFLVNRNGLIATGPLRGARAALEEDGVVSAGGRELLRVSVPAGSGRRVIAQMELSEVVGPVHSLARRLLAFGAVVFVLVVGALVLAARRLQAGVTEMVGSLHRAARGEFGSQVGRPVAGPARDLALAINDMQKKLADREQQVVSQRQELFCQQCELEKLNARIRTADQIKGEFVANMSHEVRTPLHAVLSLSRVLLDEKSGQLNEEQRRQVRIIERNGKSLLAMLGDILDFSKIEAGRMDVIVSDVAAGGALAAVREAVLPLAEEKQLDLVFDARADLPTIRTDAEKLHRALLNLAHNAVKFTDEGRVTLAAAGLADGGVRFTVADTGAGIPREKIPTIFEPFRQVDSSATRSAGGTGLGLSITQSLIEQLGGRLGVESTPGEGTTFSVSLPPELEFAPASTVLVVGASERTVEPIWLRMRAAGFRGGQAVCGREVRNALSQDEIGVLAVDIGMLQREGLEVLQSLANRDDPPPMLGYWVSPNGERGGYLGPLQLISGDNGACRLEVPDANPLAVPLSDPTDEQRNVAGTWARALMRPPGELLDDVVRALVTEAETALRQRVAV